MPIGTSKIGVLGAGTVPGGCQTFNSSGTFSVPPGVTKINITGRGSTGNPGNPGNSGNSGNIGYGGGGGGGGAGYACIPNNPPWPYTPQYAGSGGQSFKSFSPMPSCNNQPACAMKAANPGRAAWSTPVISPYWVNSAVAGGYGGAGGTGDSGSSGSPGSAGSAGNPGNSSSTICKVFPGGAGGNAGNAGAGGSGGSGGSGGGGGGQGQNNPSAGYGGAGGNGGGSGGSGATCPSFNPFRTRPGGFGGGGAGATNPGSAGDPGNSYNSAPFFGNGIGGSTSGVCFSGVMYPGRGPTCQSGGRGAGAGQSAFNAMGRGTRLSQNLSAQNWFCATLYFPNTPQFAPFANSTTHPVYRSGGGGGAGAQARPNGCNGSGPGGGGGGGRGNAGNPGGSGGSGGTGQAANPNTFNCVTVTPGGSFPVCVASPGGQIVISWNPQ
jgi:hypothetical protein